MYILHTLQNSEWIEVKSIMLMYLSCLYSLLECRSKGSMIKKGPIRLGGKENCLLAVKGYHSMDQVKSLKGGVASSQCRLREMD